MNTTPKNRTIWQHIIALFRYFLKPKQFNSKKILFIQLFINFLLASTVVVALHYAEDVVFFKEIKDYALDKIMYWHSDFEPKLANGQPIQRMALFEIDDETYREWGSPVLTPRDKLKALIEAAEKGGANVIAVDIGLSWSSDGCIHNSDNQSACPATSSEAKAADENLAKYLQALNESKVANAPLIILTRTYRHPLESGIVNQNQFLTKQPSFLDNYLTEEKNVFWSSTFFVVDADRLRRRWQLASLVCQDNHLTVVPSMQLLIALAQLYATDDSTREAGQVIRQFKNRLNHWASTLSCDTSQGTTIPRLCQQQDCPPLIVELPAKAGISDNSHQIDLAGGRETEKVVYRFAPPDTLDPNRLSFIIKKNARHVLAVGADVYQRIVLIGATHQDTRDNHPVPIRIKDVDGIYIVANAIDTLLRFGQFKTQPVKDKLIVSVVLIVVVTLIFTFFDIVFAFVFSTILLGVLGLWSFQALHHGMEIDIALRLLAIQIFQLVLRFFGIWKFLQNILKGENHHA